MSVGYAHSPKGPGCFELGTCPRRVAQQKHQCGAEFFEECRVVHAEMAAILAAPTTKDLIGTSLLLLGLTGDNLSIYGGAFPCKLCLRHIVEVRIQSVCIVISPHKTIMTDVEDITL